MNKLAKVVSVSLILCGTLYGAGGGASAAHFSSPQGKKAQQVGGIVGNTAFFMYPNNDAANVKDPTTLNAMAALAKKQICQGKDTRMLVEEMGLQVMFVYPNKKDGSVTVLTIESCDDTKGIKKEK